jgi:hypothetical protein
MFHEAIDHIMALARVLVMKRGHALLVGVKSQMEPRLSCAMIAVDGQKKIALRGEYIAYDDRFRVYLSTKYLNPVYSPEVCSQVTLGDEAHIRDPRRNQRE